MKKTEMAPLVLLRKCTNSFLDGKLPSCKTACEHFSNDEIYWFVFLNLNLLINPIVSTSDYSLSRSRNEKTNPCIQHPSINLDKKLTNFCFSLLIGGISRNAPKDCFEPCIYSFCHAFQSHIHDTNL